MTTPEYSPDFAKAITMAFPIPSLDPVTIAILFLFYCHFGVTVHEMDNDTKKNITLLFILSTLTSIIGFVLTDIAVIPVADGSSLYMLQFVILNIIGAIYSPFFLVCLFLTFTSRPFHIDDNNILHF